VVAAAAPPSIATASLLFAPSMIASSAPDSFSSKEAPSSPKLNGEVPFEFRVEEAWRERDEGGCQGPREECSE
jgi:hypothetical protein